MAPGDCASGYAAIACPRALDRLVGDSAVDRGTGGHRPTSHLDVKSGYGALANKGKGFTVTVAGREG